MLVQTDYTPTIMDGPVVRFKFGRKVGSHKDIFSQEMTDDWSAEISASRNGVMMTGTCGVYNDRDAIDKISDLFQQAWKCYQAIKSSRDEHEAAKEFVQRYETRPAPQSE